MIRFRIKFTEKNVIDAYKLLHCDCVPVHYQTQTTRIEQKHSSQRD